MKRRLAKELFTSMGAMRRRANLRWLSGKCVRVVACTLSLLLVPVAMGIGGVAVGGPAEKKAQRPKADTATASTPLPEQQRVGSLAAQYCDAVGNAAVEARYAQLSSRLEVMAKQLDGRIAKLDAQSVLLRDWMAKRDAFAQKATQQLVSIFGSMRPEAASEQLVRLDPVTAASILLRLDSRVASTILNDMPPDKAAKLAGIIAESGRKGEGAVKP